MQLVQLSSGVRSLLFALIIISNVSFMTFWVYKSLHEAKKMLVGKFESVYLLFCLCKNK